jgi:hypothetical protein
MQRLKLRTINLDNINMLHPMREWVERFIRDWWLTLDTGLMSHWECQRLVNKWDSIFITCSKGSGWWTIGIPANNSACWSTQGTKSSTRTFQLLSTLQDSTMKDDYQLLQESKTIIGIYLRQIDYRIPQNMVWVPIFLANSWVTSPFWGSVWGSTTSCCSGTFIY